MTWSNGTGDGRLVERSLRRPVAAAQAAAGSQPRLIPNALNGHAVVEFDGVDDRLDISSNLFSSSSTPKTVFAVVRSTDTDGHIIGTGSSSTGYLPTFGNALAIAYGTFYYKANSNSVGLGLHSFATTVKSRWQIVSAVVSENNSRLETACSVAVSSASLNPYNYSNATIGATGTQVDPLDGYIAALLVYDRALSDGELESVRDHLG
jgi:hypothetical protein